LIGDTTQVGNYIISLPRVHIDFCPISIVVVLLCWLANMLLHIGSLVVDFGVVVNAPVVVVLQIRVAIFGMSMVIRVMIVVASR